jgi:hypothetical protein
MLASASLDTVTGMNRKTTGQAGIAMGRWLVAGAVALGSWAGCGDDPVAPETTASMVEEGLRAAESASGPASGDFSECTQSLLIDNFNNGDLPPDLEIVNGRLQLRSGTESRPDMWIANTLYGGTMSDQRGTSLVRINLENGQLRNYYPVGARAQSIVGRTIDRVGLLPSRTAVDLDFNVYVGQRFRWEYAFTSGGVDYYWDGGGESVTKIDANHVCPATGECTGAVLWQVRLDGVPRALAVDAQNRPWVGLHNREELVRLNSTTGAVEARYGIPTRQIYGMAIDGAGLLWYAVLEAAAWTGPGGVGCFDTNTNTSCGFFRMRRSDNTTSGQIYGIAVDQQGNVWTGMWSSGGIGRIDRASFDAARAAGLPLNETNVTTQHLQFALPESRTMAFSRGVAVDANGIIWVASYTESRVYRYNPASGTVTGSAATCIGPIGVGISEEGHVWTMCYDTDRARAFNLATMAQVYDVAIGYGPYSYSDFTGFALRNITAPTGVYRRLVDCGPEGCGFDWMDWDAVIPVGAGLEVRWRGSVDGTTWSEWSPFYDTPPEFVLPGGLTPRYIEIEVAFAASPSGQSPTLGSVTFWRCPQDNPPSDLVVDNRWINVNPSDFGISWAFTDRSWPEEFFQGWEINNSGVPVISRCSLLSETSNRMGDRYQGGAPRPACAENGLPSNHLARRAFRSARRNSSGSWVYSPFGATAQGYTLVNNPTAANSDLVLTPGGAATVLVQWCRPLNNQMQGLTGARLERSTNASFTSPTVLASWDNPLTRGYAPGGGNCGSATDTNGGLGLIPGETYWYRLTFRNGDGIPSQPLVRSVTTFGGPCCYLGICVGVCIDGELTAAGCEPPPTYQANETLCDGLDNDCDGGIDEGLINACGTCGPLPVEVCNGLDDDCNGIIDDNPVDGTRYYRDADGDGFGDPGNSVVACSQPSGYVTNNLDCNDANPNIRPGAFDICNGIDDNCNGAIDEDDPPSTWFRDVDGDGFGNPSATVVACTAPAGHVAVGGDCDDSRDFVYPGAPELCNDIDDNCNGVIDEGFMQATVTVVSIHKRTDPAAPVCGNSPAGQVCEGNLAATVRIQNTGSVPIPTTSTLSFFRNGTAPANRVGGPMNLLTAIPVGGDVTRTYCFGPVYSATPVTMTARLQAPPALACGPKDGTLSNVSLGAGAEICDGIDNDCDGQIDERPEACGAVMDCIRNPTTGVYRCEAT